MTNQRLARVCAGLLMSAGLHAACGASLFEGQTDVGTVQHAGLSAYDEAARAYTVTGSGENIWAAHDDFHFVWKKVTAETISLAADIAILGADGDPHRKAVLMMRQSLDAGAAYADAAVHGNGLTSLQFRETPGAATHEIEVSDRAPARVRIEKRGDRFYLFAGESFAGGSARVALTAPFYIGIGVCAHRKEAVQQAAFANVEMVEAAGYSTIETINVASTDARVSYVTRERVEDAAYTADGNGLVYRIGSEVRTVGPGAGGAAAGSRTSPDGKQLAVTMEEGDRTVLAVVSVADGTLKVLARFSGGPGSVSAHPWSPDGKHLVFVSYQTIESGGKPSDPSSPGR